MTEKTTETINKEIEQIQKEFNNVEEILGYTADKNGRKHLIHRELRTFSWFVNFMIFSKEGDEFDNRFKREYNNFQLDKNVTSKEELFKWACLYYIYDKQWDKHHLMGIGVGNDD